MITDTALLTADARSQSVRKLADFLKQRQVMGDCWEAYATLEFTELDALVASADEAATNAQPVDRQRAFLDLIFLTALRRDLRYALAPRRALQAQGMNDAMMRSYRGGRVTLYHPK